MGAAFVRVFIAACVLTVVLVSPAFAGPEEDAMQVVQKWAAAFNASDVDEIVALYSPDALFMGTGSRTVVTNTAEIRQYFERALLTDRPRGAVLQSHSVMALSEGVAKRGAEWKIVHFHRSGLPGRPNS